MGTTSCCKGRFSFQLLSSQPKATMFLCSPKPEIVHLPAHTTLKRAWRVGDSQPQCWEGDLPPVQWDGPMSPLQPWIDPGLPVIPWFHPQDPSPPWMQDRLPHLMAHLGHSPPVDSPAWGPGAPPISQLSIITPCLKYSHFGVSQGLKTSG